MTQTNQSSCRIISSWLNVSALVVSPAVLNNKIIPKKKCQPLLFSVLHFSPLFNLGLHFRKSAQKHYYQICLWKLEQDVLLNFLMYQLSNEVTKCAFIPKTDLGVGGLGQTVVAGWKFFLCRKILLKQEFSLSETESSSTGKSYKKCHTYLAVLHLFCYF